MDTMKWENSPKQVAYHWMVCPKVCPTGGVRINNGYHWMVRRQHRGHGQTHIESILICDPAQPSRCASGSHRCSQAAERTGCGAGAASCHFQSPLCKKREGFSTPLVRFAGAMLIGVHIYLIYEYLMRTCKYQTHYGNTVELFIFEPEKQAPPA